MYLRSAALLPLLGSCLPTTLELGELPRCGGELAQPLEGGLRLDPRDAPFRLAIFPELYPERSEGAVLDDIAALEDELATGPLAALAGPGAFAFDVFQVAPTSARAGGRLLASCLEDDPLGGELPYWHADLSEAWRFAPDADAVIVLFNHLGGRANAPYGGSQITTGEGLVTATRVQGRSVLMGRHDGRGTLTHELGHALFDLGDEYADADGCFSPSLGFAAPADVITPNLTLDASGARFAPFGLGAREGGARHTRCVFHPDAPCLMESSSWQSFCPVCAARVAQVLVRQTAADESPPRCHLSAWSDPARITTDAWSLFIDALDESAPVSALVTIGDHGVARAVSDSARLGVALTLERDDLERLPATLTVQCSDRLGNLSRTSMELARE